MPGDRFAFPAARGFAHELAHAALDGGSEGRDELLARLARLTAREWLLVDQAARTFRYESGTPVSGVRGWLLTGSNRPADAFMTLVASLHVDGRIRERATLMLADGDVPFAGSAIGLRLLDHVPQVRSVAQDRLSLLDLKHALAALEVVLTGEQRQHGGTATAAVEARLIAIFGGRTAYAAYLRASESRTLRRRGFVLSRELDDLGVRELVEAACVEHDQLILKWCSDWLLAEASDLDFEPLLRARSAHVREVATLRVPDNLARREARRMLLDPARRVREAAQFRCRRLEVDSASEYRSVLGVSLTPGVRATALDGLRATGGAEDSVVFENALDSDSPRVRAAAIVGVAGWASASEQVRLLSPLLYDASPRVCATAARVLAKTGATDAAAAAWASDQVWTRRAAWRLARSGGGWSRVEADLTAASDEDSALAGLGDSSVRNWLATQAATTWGQLSIARRKQLADLLEAWPADEHYKRLVAFHAGIRSPRPTPPPEHEPSDPADRRRRWWQRDAR